MNLSLSSWILFAILCACLSAILNYLHSDGKHRLTLLIFTLAGCIVTYFGERKSIKGYEKTAAVIEGIKTGGSAFPIISLGLTREPFKDGYYYTFRVQNASTEYSLFNISMSFVQVSTKTMFVYDDSLPTVIYEDKFLQPNSTSETDYYIKDLQLSDQIPERRYNFFIKCKNGLFEEQLIVRQIGKEVETATQIIKDEKIIYTSEIESSFLFPGEKKLVFQDADEGLIKGTIEEEREKWRGHQYDLE